MPARRTWALMIVAALALAGGGIWLLNQNTPTNAGPQAPLECCSEVWVIPGRGGDTTALSLLVDALERERFTVTVVNIGNGTDAVDTYANDLLRRLESHGQPVDLVGYSAGGIIARKAATMDGTLIRRIATIATPHNGTSLANLGRIVGCDRMCQDLAVDSDLLESLNHAVDPERWLVIWTSSDDVIRPAENAALEGALNLHYQQQCGRDISHSAIVQDRNVTRWITQWLTSGTSGTC